MLIFHAKDYIFIYSKNPYYEKANLFNQHILYADIVDLNAAFRPGWNQCR